MPGHHLLAALTGVGNHPHGHISRSPPQHTSTTVQRVTTLARALVDRRELRVPGTRSEFEHGCADRDQLAQIRSSQPAVVAHVVAVRVAMPRTAQ